VSSGMRLWQAFGLVAVILLLIGCRESPVAPTPTSAIASATSKQIPVPQELVTLSHRFTVGTLAFSPDDGQLAAGDWNGDVRIWDTATWQQDLVMTHDDAVEVVTFSPDGQRLATASFDHTARLWDTNSGQQVAEIVHRGWVYGVAFSSDGDRLASGSLDGTVHIWDVPAVKETDVLTHELMVHDLALSSDGQWLATMLTGKWGPGAVQVWDLSTRQAIPLVEFNGVAYSNVVFSPDDRYLAAGLGGGGPVAVWEIPAWREVTQLATSFEGEIGTPDILAFSPDGQRLAGVSPNNPGERGIIWIWDTSTWRELLGVETEDVVWTMAFSPDSRTLAIGLGQGVEHLPVNEAQLWDVSSGTLLARMPHERQVSAVAFSHDGRWLATSGADSLVHVWDLQDASTSTRPAAPGVTSEPRTPATAPATAPAATAQAIPVPAPTLAPIPTATPVPNVVGDRMAVATSPDRTTRSMCLNLRDRGGPSSLHHPFPERPWRYCRTATCRCKAVTLLPYPRNTDLVYWGQNNKSDGGVSCSENLVS
jgi:WD40 repeat protein